MRYQLEDPVFDALQIMFAGLITASHRINGHMRPFPHQTCVLDLGVVNGPHPLPFLSTQLEHLLFNLPTFIFTIIILFVLLHVLVVTV
jgi:hypothetical protein